MTRSIQSSLAAAAILAGCTLLSTAALADNGAVGDPLGQEPQRGTTLVAPTAGVANNGGTSAGEQGPPQPEESEGTGEVPAAGESLTPQPGPPSTPGELLNVPRLSASVCGGGEVPAALIPLYRRAADRFMLGPQGAAVLAAINSVESAFGTNLGPSSAGAIGWMQFMPATWEEYGLDANGDGVEDPNNPEDAIFAAAGYLRAAGMPTDTYGAIYAYNHADWYVQEVLERAGCFAIEVGGDFSSSEIVAPQIEVLACRPRPGAGVTRIPDAYLAAFEDSAARYELGQRGVWVLAAVARLESDFGRGISEGQRAETGPLGLQPSEWRRYGVDGDGDGRIRRASVDDSAATLAREMWSTGDLQAGLFAHNHAEWYVQAVLREAEELAGTCKVSFVDWQVAPLAGSLLIDWRNLTLSNDLERRDLLGGTLDSRVVALIATITRRHQLTITSLRSDHSELTTSGNVSNHFVGRALDIGSVDGVSCNETSTTGPCAELGYELASLGPALHPTELIYCFDLDGPGPAFALPDHCDHVHAGFDS